MLSSKLPVSDEAGCVRSKKCGRTRFFRRFEPREHDAIPDSGVIERQFLGYFPRGELARHHIEEKAGDSRVRQMGRNPRAHGSRAQNRRFLNALGHLGFPGNVDVTKPERLGQPRNPSIAALGYSVNDTEDSTMGTGMKWLNSAVRGLRSFAYGPDHDRPHLGLALGGGFARGIAHIGVLRALEEAGIRIDFLAGYQRRRADRRRICQRRDTRRSGTTRFHDPLS